MKILKSLMDSKAVKSTLASLAFALVCAGADGIPAVLAEGNSAESQAAVSGKIHAKIHADRVVNRVDERVYSHFLEHIYHSCNGGLWGELVWNRSFETGRSNSWSRENGKMTQASVMGNPRLVFGNPEWTDYEISCEARKLDGQEAFLILCRVSGDEYLWANLGGWQNSQNALEWGFVKDGKEARRRVTGNFTEFQPFETGKTYRLCLRVEGSRFQMFVDGKQVFDCTCPDGPAKGCAGLGTWSTAAEFSNIMVRDLDGKVLFDGNQTEPKPLTPPEVRFWEVTGNVAMKSGEARNCKNFLSFSESAAISQKNFRFEKGEKYDWSCWVRGAGTLTFQGEAREVDSAEWTKLSGTFRVSETTNEGTLEIAAAPESGRTLELDQVSIMPRSWKENFSGFRPDLLEAIRAIQPKTLRWPGGCYASVYRWKAGIGPQEDRETFPIELWNDVDVNSYGTDEFLKMCELVGTDPVIVVNIGTKPWRNRAGIKDGEVDWIAEACAWLEYCNGPADSRWGAVRAKNGHPEPYGVKYWEIDNEVHPGISPEDYCAIVRELASKMKAIDPSITVIACGSHCCDRDAWDSAVIQGAGEHFAYLSTHRYDNPEGYAVNPYENMRFFESRREMIAKSGNPHIKIFDSEWNAQSTDWRTGLHAGGILNCFEKVGDVVELAAPALFLRHTSADAWDNAFINFDHTGWYPAPNYVVMKLWREHYAPNRVELVSDSPELNGKNPIVNAVATRSEDGKTVFVKVVNNQMEDSDFTLTLCGAESASASALTVTPVLEADEKAASKLQKRNTLSAPESISPKPLNVICDGSRLKVRLPSLSATVLRISLK